MPEITRVKRGLGRGLDTLLPPTENVETHVVSYKEVNIDNVVPSRLQPRTLFDEDQIADLANSISEHGVIEPLIVSSLPNGRYELIAGERRLRGSKKAGLSKVPVVIKDVDSESILLMSLVENIQRQDLNPIEEANAYKTLMEEFNYTQEDAAKKLGKSRSSIANTLRLLDLPEEAKEDVLMGRYTAGHARSLLSITDIREREKLRQKLISGISVREAEIEARVKEKRNPGTSKKIDVDPMTAAIRNVLGTKVTIKRNSKGKGKIVIEFYSDEDLNRLMNLIGKKGVADEVY